MLEDQVKGGLLSSKVQMMSNDLPVRAWFVILAACTVQRD